MNLHGIVSPYIASINPMTIGSVLASTGNITAADGSQMPSWQRTDNVQLQVQALSSDDLQQLDGVAVSALTRAVYLNGNIEGIDRPVGRGGDVLVFDGSAWLVTQVLEPWDANGWTKVAVTKQGPSSTALQASLVPLLKTIGVI